MSKFLTSICHYYGVSFTKFKKLFFETNILNLLYFLPLFLIKTPFRDDYHWIFKEGYSQDDNVGRFLIEWLYSSIKFIFGTNEKTFGFNIQPTYQVLSVLIFTAAVTIFTLKITKSKKIACLALISFAFLANPFLIEAFSYHILSLSSITAYALAVFASLNNKNKISDIGVGSILLFAALSLYQVALNIYLACTIFIFLVSFSKNTQVSISQISNNLVKLLVAALTHLAVVKLGTNYNWYFNQRSHFSTLDDSFASSLISKVQEFNKLASSVIIESKLMIAFMLAAMILYSVYYLTLNKNKNWVLNMVILIASTIAIYLCSFGFLVLFENPVYYARVFAGFSVFLALLFYMFLSSTSFHFPKISKLAILPVVFLFFINYSYVNLRLLEINLNKYTALKLTNRLESLELKPETEIILANGMTRKHSHINKIKNNTVLKMLLKSRLHSWFLPEFIRYHFGTDYNLIRYPSNEKTIEICKDRFVIESDRDFKILKAENEYAIAFGESFCTDLITQSSKLVK